MVAWDLSRGEPLAALIGHRRAAASIKLSSSGRYALSGGAGKDTSVVFWKLPAVNEK